MQIVTANNWTELREHYRRVRGKTERAEEDNSLIGRIIVSNNSINGYVHGFSYIYSIGLTYLT